MTTTLPIDDYQRTSAMLTSSWWIYGTLWLPASSTPASLGTEPNTGED